MERGIHDERLKLSYEEYAEKIICLNKCHVVYAAN